MPLPDLKVISFDHLVLKCADVERALDFYVGTLGLQPVRVDEWRRGQVPFPSVRISAHTLIDLFSGASPGTHVDHFCLVIEPVDLDALGLLFPGARRSDQVYGARGLGRSLYVSDPDGNTVELRVYDH
jgi:catechol 2,3-dioxygenase-like lactoylglutathione lyase family enzyme